MHPVRDSPNASRISNNVDVNTLQLGTSSKRQIAQEKLDNAGQGGSSYQGFQVTTEGVAIKKDGNFIIPSNYVENPNRSSNYGVIDPITNKFVEKLRIDPPTPSGKKGPEHSHYHVNNSKEHFSPKPGDQNPGFK